MNTSYPTVPSDATALLRALVAKDLRTIGVRAMPNRIVEVRPPRVMVATERSPKGREVKIAEVQAALDILRKDGEVEITPPVIGHRSSFIGAVLATIPGAQVKGSAPPRISVR